MRPIFVVAPLVASGLSVAQRGQVHIGSSGAGPGIIHGNASRFREANRNPNASTSIDFSISGQDGWTWRVNVTDISVPDATNLDVAPEPIGPDPHVINTVHDFTWPNSTANLNQTIENLQGPQWEQPLCISLWEGFFWPNLTNKLDESNNDGSCEPVLGEKCTKAIKEGFWGGGYESCATPALSNDNECGSLFSRNANNAIGVGMTVFTISLSRTGSDPKNSTRFQRYSDEVFFPPSVGDAAFHQATKAYPSSNETSISEVESKLQMIALTGGHTSDGMPIKELLCTRVDPSIDDYEVSAIADEARNSDDESTGTEDEDSTGTSDASNETSSSAADACAHTTAGSVGMASLFALLGFL